MLSNNFPVLRVYLKNQNLNKVLTIKLPIYSEKGKQEFNEALKEINASPNMEFCNPCIANEGIKFQPIIEVSNDLDALSKAINNEQDINELNYFADLIYGLDLTDSQGYEKFMAATYLMTNNNYKLKDYINLIENLDNFRLIEDVSNHYELGERAFIDSGDLNFIPEHMLSYIDFEKKGREIATEEVLEITPYGCIIQDTSKPFIEVYKGTMDIPEENRIVGDGISKNNVKESLLQKDTEGKNISEEIER